MNSKEVELILFLFSYRVVQKKFSTQYWFSLLVKRKYLCFWLRGFENCNLCQSNNNIDIETDQLLMNFICFVTSILPFLLITVKFVKKSFAYDLNDFLRFNIFEKSIEIFRSGSPGRIK